LHPQHGLAQPAVNPISPAPSPAAIRPVNIERVKIICFMVVPFPPGRIGPDAAR